MTSLPISLVLVSTVMHAAWNLLARVVCSLGFFQPLVWLLARRLEDAGDEVADDFVLSLGADSRSYAQDLADIAEGFMPSRPEAAAGLGVVRFRSSLGRRVARILDAARQLTTSISWRGVLSIYAIIALVSALSACLSLTAAPEASTNEDPGASQEAERASVTDERGRTDERTDTVIIAVDLCVNQLDKSLKPLAGVSVTVPGHEVDLTTDKEGRVRIQLPVPAQGSFEITLRKEGFVPRLFRWESVDDVPDSYVARFERAHPIGGVVTDRIGNLVEGATVHLRLAGTGRYGFREWRLHPAYDPVKTDANGRWACDGMPKRLNRLGFRLEHPDYLNDADWRWSRYRYGHRDKIRLLIVRPITLSGTLTNKEGRPIAGASVLMGKSLIDFEKRTTTDDDGRFTFPRLRTSNKLITIDAEGYTPEIRNVQSEELRGDRVDIEVTLRPGMGIGGHVTDQRGKAVPNATVALYSWQGCKMLKRQSVTGELGAFLLKDVDLPGENQIVLSVTKPGYMQIYETYVPSRLRRDTTFIRLPRQLKIHGKIVEAKTLTPITGARVIPGWSQGRRGEIHWDQANTFTSTNGKYEVASFHEFPEADASYFVRLEAPGYEPAVSRPFRSHEETQLYDFPLKRLATLTGVVTDPDGKPVANCEVLLFTPPGDGHIVNARPDKDSDWIPTKTDHEGRYVFPVESRDYLVVALDDRGFAEALPDDVAAGRTALVLQPWGRVEGEVRTGPRLWTNCKVDLSMQRPKQLWNWRCTQHYTTHTDKQGRFVMERVTPGKASLYVGHGVSELAPKQAQVQAGETFWVMLGRTGGRTVTGKITLPLGHTGTFANHIGSIGGRLIPLSGTKRDSSHSGKWHCGMQIQKDGSFRVEAVPPGKYRLIVNEVRYRLGGWPGQYESVVASAEREVHIPASPEGKDEPFDLGTVAMESKE